LQHRCPEEFFLIRPLDSSAAWPLAGPRILVTRPEDAGNAAFLAALQRAGGQVFHLPLIQVRAMAFTPPDFQAFDWVFLTSKNAVKALEQCFDALKACGNSIKIACVGPSTEQAIKAYGLKVDFVSPVHDAESAARFFTEAYPVEGLRIFWPCGNLANSRLKVSLTSAGAIVTPLLVYETVLHTDLTALERELLLQPLDLMVFTSSSAVEALARIRAQAYFKIELPDIACLGPQTTAAALELLGHVEIQAEPHTLEGLSQAIEAYFKNKKGKQ
jgi:uroporphyrinogen-III synthase